MRSLAYMLATGYIPHYSEVIYNISNNISDMSDNDGCVTVNRRKALQLGGTTLAALTGAAGVVVAGDGEDRVEFVRYIKGSPSNQTKVYDSVSFEHWSARFTADDVRQQIAKRIKDKWGADSAIRPEFMAMEESPTGFGVSVNYLTHHTHGETRTPEPSIEQVKRELPDRATGTAELDGHAARREGIPVRVVRAEQRPAGANCDGEDGGCQSTLGYDTYVPGGVMAVYDPNDTSGGYATINCPFNSEDYGEGWVGTGHGGDVGDVVEIGGDVIGEIKEQ